MGISKEYNFWLGYISGHCGYSREKTIKMFGGGTVAGVISLICEEKGIDVPDIPVEIGRMTIC